MSAASHAFQAADTSPPLSTDLSVGLGFDTGTQGALASIGTSEGLTGTNVRVGGKDVTARGTVLPILVAFCVVPTILLLQLCMSCSI